MWGGLEIEPVLSKRLDYPRGGLAASLEQILPLFVTVFVHDVVVYSSDSMGSLFLLPFFFCMYT